MISLGRNVKIWSFITLCTLLAWILYWIPSSIDRFFGMDGTPWSVILENLGPMFVTMEMSGAIGMLFRLVGIILGLASAFFIFQKAKTFFEIKKWVVWALIFESIYFFLLLPSGLLMVGIGGGPFVNLTTLLLGIDYLLLVFFTGPFLLILAIKLHKYSDGIKGFSSWNWVAITFVAYVLSLWVNSVIKWFDMVAAEGLSFFFTGIRGIGAVNSILFMSLALLFSIIGSLKLAKKDFTSVMKWYGLTFVLIGIHYTVFVVYSFLTGQEGFLMLAEIWTIPLLGLGLSMLLKPLKSNFI